RIMKRVLLILFGFLLMSSTVLYAQKVTIGNVSFDLAPDYKVEGKMSLPVDDVLNKIDQSGTVTGYVALVFFYLVAALNYWLAYRRMIFFGNCAIS
nr:hypothetical protein [Prevotella sp.]